LIINPSTSSTLISFINPYQRASCEGSDICSAALALPEITLPGSDIFKLPDIQVKNKIILR
jgi:hypothetical protein